MSFGKPQEGLRQAQLLARMERSGMRVIVAPLNPDLSKLIPGYLLNPATVRSKYTATSKACL